MSESTARVFFLHALTPVHSGTGQAAAVIDLPIAREKATGWPILPASSLKGVLRDTLATGADAWDGGAIERAFGQIEEAGALCLGDQRIVCFPARSFWGTFAYVSAPLALTRLARDYRAAGLAPPFGDVPKAASATEILLPDESDLAREERVYLEDLDFSAISDAAVASIADGLAGALFPQVERPLFTRRFALLADEVFSFLCETATEVTARVRLKPEEKTVADGGLWYEEAVPAETIFAGPAIPVGRHREEVGRRIAALAERTLQIGGKASVGRGLCRLVVAP
jgi:CRISPR-associated protein Cmr4